VRLRVRRETRGMERESERVNPNVLGFSSAKSLTLHTRLKKLYFVTSPVSNEGNATYWCQNNITRHYLLEDGCVICEKY